MSPRKASTTCPRCRTKHRAGDRCPTCTARRRAIRRAKDASFGFYQSAAWTEGVRRPYLEQHPTCCLCGAASQVPDHHPKSRRQLLGEGVTDPDAWHRLRPLCLPCHHRETGRNQPPGSAPPPPRPKPPPITF